MEAKTIEDWVRETAPEEFDYIKWENDWKQSLGCYAQQAGLATPTYDDMVYSPPHYKTFPDMDAIDIISIVLSPEEFAGYLRGNYLKYKLRAGMKNDGVQDLEKAAWYRDELFAYEQDRREED